MPKGWQTHMYFWGDRVGVLKGPVSSEDGRHRRGIALFVCAHTQACLPHELPLVGPCQPHGNLLNDGLLHIVLAPLQEALHAATLVAANMQNDER